MIYKNNSAIFLLYLSQTLTIFKIISLTDF